MEWNGSGLDFPDLRLAVENLLAGEYSTSTDGVSGRVGFTKAGSICVVEIAVRIEEFQQIVYDSRYWVSSIRLCGLVDNCLIGR